MTLLDRIRKIHGKLILFIIERSMDDEIVVYHALRQGNTLVGPKVDCFWLNKADLKKPEEMSAKAKELFFGADVKIIGGKYKMVVASCPQKVITLHLRKSGAVVAKTLLKNKESIVDHLSVVIEQPSTLSIPQATSMTIHGTHNKDPVSQRIPITEEMRSKFDISSFLPGVSQLWTNE